MNKQIIVNADDFAETEAITSAILECHGSGSVTSTSVIVTTPYWATAQELIAQTPSLDYGLHLNITSGSPCSGDSRLDPLLDEDGRYPKPLAMLRALLLHRPAPEALEAELFAQAERLASTGVRISHLDFNDHLFFLGDLWRICLRIREAFGIPFIRRPYQQRTIHAPFSPQSLKRVFLNSWFRSRRSEHSVDINCFDCLGSEKLEDAYPAILANCEAVTELVVHPALADPGLADDDYHRCRIYEYEYLATEKLSRLAHSRDVALVCHRDLVH